MKIEINQVEDSNGECELGCWNEAYGYRVTIDGVVYEDLMPFATCCSSQSYNAIDLVKLILAKTGRPDIEVKDENSI